MAATPEEMKAEAIARMELLGIAQETVDAFKQKAWVGMSAAPHGTCVTNREPVLISENIKANVEKFEKKYGYLVYHVIETEYEDGNIYCFLYVCPKKETWEEGRAALKAGTPDVYIYNEYDSFSCQIGKIGIKHAAGSEGGIVRTA